LNPVNNPTKEITMTSAFTAKTADAIAAFATDLQNSIDMGDRKQAVKYLAEKIGAESAKQVAQVFGLRSSYYFA
jgi:hypothetical protein